MILERHTQEIFMDKWEELEALDKKFNAVESRLGFPAKKRYRCYIGGHTINTIVVEREWDSLAAMEAAYEKTFVDPEHQSLEFESSSIIKRIQIEIYAPMP
jgi:hypothetical protein